MRQPLSAMVMVDPFEGLVSSPMVGQKIGRVGRDSPGACEVVCL
ncbi:MAG: hypothetical protein QOH37_2007, partial [Nocardioidaceae bacterium]|nr:hypothetical protein [Nocardioidaceae bacterium]